MKKQVYIMLGIIVVLGVVALVAINVGPNRSARKKMNQSVLGSIKLKDIKSIDINSGSVILNNSDGVWSYMNKNDDGVLVPKPTRQDYVDEFLNSLSKFTKGQLIDSEPDNLAKYSLTEKDNMRVLILKDEKDEELLRIKIGVMVGSNSANYAQINQVPSVYKVDSSLTHFLNQGDQYWQDLRLFPRGIDTKKVKSIKISRKGKEDIVLTKRKQEWEFEDESQLKADKNAVENYIGDMTEIRAFSFSNPVLKDDFKTGTVEFQMEGNKLLQISLYNFADNYFVTTVGGQEQEILDFKEYSINKIFPDKSLFEDKNDITSESELPKESKDVTKDSEIETEPQKK